jgi:hypothetical protein
MTKARACKGAGQKGSPKVTSHALGSAGECEGLNLHTPKWARILGIQVPIDSWTFIERLQGSKPIKLKFSLYHWQALGTYKSKMGLHDSFEHLKHKLWPKEGSGIKLTIWLPTIKSRESPQFACVQVACDIPLESFCQWLKLCFKPHLNQRSTHKIMGPQSCRNPNGGNFETPNFWDKMTFGCWSYGQE